MGISLRRLKMASFRRSTLAALQTAVNDFTAGKPLTDVQSGTVAYSAGERAERTLVDQQYTFSDIAGLEVHTLVLFYIE
jgi:hypothetical protein